MSLNNHFGEALKRILVEKKISQVELANLLNVTKATVTSYMKAKSPHKTTLDRILVVLDLTEDEFYGNHNYKVISEPTGAGKTEGKLIDFEQKYYEKLATEVEYLKTINELQRKLNELEKAKNVKGESPISTPSASH